MPQSPSKPTTRYEILSQPPKDIGYLQRIPMWEAVQRLGSVNRAQLLTELLRQSYVRPKGAPVDEGYCRVELTDMTKRGFLRRIFD